MIFLFLNKLIFTNTKINNDQSYHVPLVIFQSSYLYIYALNLYLNLNLTLKDRYHEFMCFMLTNILFLLLNAYKHYHLQFLYYFNQFIS